jgi:GntR family transcriptional regulator
MIVIDRDEDRPIYRQLADILRGQIVSGELQPGQFLPSQGRLAQEHGMGTDAARKALAVVRSEGLIVTVKGKGSFVRVPEPVTTVTIRAGESLVARMPSPAESRSLGITDGIPVLVITRANGEIETHPADGVRIEVKRGQTRT